MQTSIVENPYKKLNRKPLLRRVNRLKRVTLRLGGKKRSQGKRKPKNLKRELDRLFSLYIRGKYPKKCYTCGKAAAVLQCGHFVPRTYLATRWEEDNCRPQCVGCNIWGRGQLLDFEENLKEELGVARVEQLKQKRNELWKLKPEWYEEKITHYQKLLSV